MSTLLIALPMVFTQEKANAQEDEIFVSINFELGVPQGPFRDQLERVGYGVDFQFGYMLPYLPFGFGLDFGVMTFGTDRRNTPLSPTIPDVRVTVENSYNLIHGHLFARIGGRNETFRPYLDALVGLNYLYTDSVVRSRMSGEEVFRDTNFDDYAFSYGLGAGASWRVYTDPESNVRLYLNFQTKYLIGGEAEYLKQGSITIENGQVFYDVSRSATNLLYFQLGLKFAL